jgi:hypothetical protein
VKRKIHGIAIAMMVCASLLMTGAHAQLKPADTTSKSAKVKSKKKSTGAQKMPKFLPGSQESVKDRNNRLQRECKGAVNAGACRGFTG